MPIRTDGKISIAVWSALVVVVTIATIGSIGTRSFVSDAKWVSHTQAVRGELQQVARHVDAAKADVRGFLLTNDSAYLRRHRANLDSMDAAFRRVEALTSDNKLQQTRLTTIRALLTERESAFETTLALRTLPQSSLSTVGERLTIGELLTARVDSAIRAADDAERQLLAARSVRQTASERFVTLTSAAIVLAAIALGLLLRRSIKRDLVGRARAEAELRASEAKFAGILAIAADAIITVDEKQSILHFNHGAQEIFGYQLDEVVGQPLEMLLPARHASTHRSHVAAFATGEGTARRMGERRSIHGRRKDGTEFSAEASISKLLTPTGFIFTAVLRDVTEQRRREEFDHALATAGAQLAQSLGYDETLAAVATLPVPAVGAWTMLDMVDEDENGEPTFRRLTSRHPDPSIDAALREREAMPLDADSPDAVIDVLRTGRLQHIATVSDDWLGAHVASSREIELARQIGMHSLMIVPLMERDRAVAAWTIGSAAEQMFDDHDVTLAQALARRAGLAIENARLFRRAQREAAARKQILGIVSHDLRNPLSAVSMLSRRLAENPPSEQECRSIGNHILASVDWMHRLMEDLLDAASIDAGKLSVVVEPQSVGQILETATNMFAEQAASQGVTLTCEIPPVAPWALCDASRVIQVLANLCGNALKFTPSGGVVTMSAREEGEEVTLSVRDSGVGIPPADLPHVFDRFWHADRNARKRGTGLGLAIAHGIVRAHGGRIWVESTVGKGSEFLFTLPRVQPTVPFSMTLGASRATEPR